MLQETSYINRFSIFAHWCIQPWNNINIDGLKRFIMKKIIKFFKLFKRRIDIFGAETQLKFILENN